MFCTKCGSQLEDGVKFCTNCGAPTVFAKAAAPAVPAAVPEEPAAAAQTPAEPTAAPVNGRQQPPQSQPNAWQQPQQGQQPPQWQQPQQPQPNARQQPQQGQPGAWKQPQQGQPGAWQQPQQGQQQPPQWQQIQQQWQARQQQQQPWPQQPAQQPTRQPQQQWQQPLTRGGAPAKPKKSGKGLLIGIIAAVLVLVVGVGGFVWPGFFKGNKSASAAGGPVSTVLAEKFSTPEEYYRAVETNNAAALSGHVASVYDNVFLSNAASDDIGVTGSLRIEPGDKVRELLLDAIGEQLEQINPGDDLTWLKSFSLAYDISKKDDLRSLSAALKLNDTDLAHVNGILQTQDGVVCLSVPELSDKYFRTTLEDLNLDQLNLTGKLNLGSVLGGLSPEDAEKLDPVMKALPDSKTVSKLLDKYLSEAVDCVDDVKKETGTLTAEDVSAEYTVLTSTITPETAVRIVEKIGPELKEDKDIRKAILDVAAAAEKDGEAKYKEFTDKIDELLNDTSRITEKMKDNVVVTVYLDKSGDVHGRVIENGSQKLELLMPEKSGQFGLTIRLTQDGAEKLLISGSGKRSGDKLTGDLDLTVDGEYYAVLGLDGFDIEKVKDGFLVGAIDVRPTASLWSKLTGKTEDGDGESKIPESLKGILDALVLRLELNTSKDKAAVTLILSNGSDRLITIALDGARSSAKKISPVEGIEASDWASEITLDKLEKVVASIEKAGVPTPYTDLLDQFLDSSFD